MPTADTAGQKRRQFHTLRVAEVQHLCDDAVAITFDVPEEEIDHFDFRPGQTLTLRRREERGEERRSYSICSPRGNRPKVGVRLVPEGLFSTWLTTHVQPGDEVEALPPTGNFTPDLTRTGHHVLIAAGSGITPVLSIAASLLQDTESHVTLVYGNRRSDTVMFADELADLKDTYPARLDLVHVLSREPRESELLSGRLDADKLRALLGNLVPRDGDEQWWLCGPHGMVTDASHVLEELDVPAANVHRELFYVDVPPEPVHHDEPAAEGPTADAVITLDGRTTSLTVPRDVPVLDSAQKVRPDLPFACKGGVCGTCRARLTEGEVRMRRNFALEPSDVDDGFVLTCQSLPVSDTLAVDYDT